MNNNWSDLNGFSLYNEIPGVTNSRKLVFGRAENSRAEVQMGYIVQHFILWNNTNYFLIQIKLIYKKNFTYLERGLQKNLEVNHLVARQRIANVTMQRVVVQIGRWGTCQRDVPISLLVSLDVHKVQAHWHAHLVRGFKWIFSIILHKDVHFHTRAGA